MSALNPWAGEVTRHVGHFDILVYCFIYFHILELNRQQ
jgi:hypothetical protein